MKILIIDDEILARQSLMIQIKKCVNANLYEAENVEKALEVLKKENPELVFVDIRMPGMSGIEFMECARKINNQTFFVVLSGYDSFEYAQKAMEYNAFRYLLKPVGDYDIQVLLLEIEEKLLAKEQQIKKYEKVFLSEQKKKRSLQRKYIYEFLNVKKSRRFGIQKKLQELGVLFEYSYFQIFLIRIGISMVMREDEEILKLGLCNIAKEVFENDGTVELFDDISGVGFLFNTDMEYCDSAFEEKATTLYAEINKFCKAIGVSKVTIGIGNRKLGIELLDEIYDSAKQTLGLYLTGGEDRLYFAWKPEENEFITSFNKYDWEKRFTKGLMSEDKKAVIECVNDFYDQYSKGNMKSIKVLQKLHLSFFVLLLKTVRNYNCDENFEDEFYYYNKIQSLDSIEEMRKYLLEQIETCFRMMEIDPMSGNKKVIWRGKQFIEENLENELTLNATAEFAGVSSVYFSKIFKEEEKKNFIDYVTERRMQRACELLENNVKTAEICARIGYHDVKHFYKVFKRYMGVTPSQYKKKIR